MKLGLLLSLILFVAACCTPALEFRHSSGPNTAMWGAAVLGVGWSGIFAGVVAWYANPFWLLGMVLAVFRQRKVGVAAGIIAAIIASTTFFVIGRELPADEGDVTHMAIVRLLPGCYCWLASLVTLPVAALVQR
jgi:hypothetical protein